MPYLLTSYNNYLASIGQPAVSTVNQDLEWLWWTYSPSVCGSGSSTGIQIRVNGVCQNFSAFDLISSQENPLVEFNCGANSPSGIYTFFLRATNPITGCQKTSRVCFDVSTCSTPCVSSVNISVSGCNLLAATTNCPSPTYQWIDPDNIVVGSGSSITATKTGVYTVRVYNCPNCSVPVTDTVYVDCNPVVECNCSPILILQDCVIYATNCAGYTVTWQSSTSPSSGFTSTGITGTNFVPPINNRYYRAQYSKSGCPTFVTSSVYVNCLCTSLFNELDLDIITGCELGYIEVRLFKVDYTGSGTPQLSTSATLVTGLTDNGPYWFFRLGVDQGTINFTITDSSSGCSQVVTGTDTGCCTNTANLSIGNLTTPDPLAPVGWNLMVVRNVRTKVCGNINTVNNGFINNVKFALNNSSNCTAQEIQSGSGNTINLIDENTFNQILATHGQFQYNDVFVSYSGGTITVSDPSAEVEWLQVDVDYWNIVDGVCNGTYLDTITYFTSKY